MPWSAWVQVQDFQFLLTKPNLRLYEMSCFAAAWVHFITTSKQRNLLSPFSMSLRNNPQRTNFNVESELTHRLYNDFLSINYDSQSSHLNKTLERMLKEAVGQEYLKKIPSIFLKELYITKLRKMFNYNYLFPDRDTNLRLNKYKTGAIIDYTPASYSAAFLSRR
jgi:hypothetical protein